MPTDRPPPDWHQDRVRSSVRVNTSAHRHALVPGLEDSELHGPAATTTVFPGVTMIATCANPACNIPFHYFRSGQIFMVEANDNHVDPRSRTDHPKRRIEYFWLCGECATTMRLMRTTEGAVIICPVPRPSDPAVDRRIAFAREVTPWIRAPKVVRSKLG